jgi:uncharacterized membrane protein (UPF0127 family)
VCCKHIVPVRRSRSWRKGVIFSLLSLCFSGCGGSTENSNTSLPDVERNNLNTMKKSRISIGAHQFEVWVAHEPATRELGLMNVKESELASFKDSSLSDIHRGMLFVFPFEHPLSFWMRNTITPLDIAYIRSDGKIVSIHTMAPLETRVYPSGEPALTALEVKAGLFASLGVKVGDSVQIPEPVLKGMP